MFYGDGNVFDFERYGCVRKVKKSLVMPISDSKFEWSMRIIRFDKDALEFTSIEAWI